MVSRAFQTATANLTSNLAVAGTVSMGYSFMRNKIINGDMRIDQRNAGTSITTTSGNLKYTVDRWVMAYAQTSKISFQQNLNSITPPAGFSHYFGALSASSYSVLAGDYFVWSQRIEGLNISDLRWGTSGAQPITVSFWVRSSLTGAFGACIRNSDSTRSYPFSYTISSADTWEFKTVTIPGDTTGTWLTDNNVGLLLGFSLGTGSTYSGTVNTWAAANYTQPTGSVSVVGTNAATWYITGVQLESGTVATPFERRLYAQELALCQRYCRNLTILPFNSTRVWASPSGSSVAQSYPFSLPAMREGAITVTLANTDVQYANSSGVFFNTTVSLSNVEYDYATSAYQFYLKCTVDGGNNNRNIKNNVAITTALVTNEL